jgi:hypothetical protein
MYANGSILGPDSHKKKGESMKTIGTIIGSVVLILALMWGIQGSDFFIYKVFAPKYEGVRRQVFEQSKAYNQGMIQELENMRFEYIKAEDSHRAALASIILHRASEFPWEQMPPDLRQFVQQLKSEVH